METALVLSEWVPRVWLEAVQAQAQAATLSPHPIAAAWGEGADAGIEAAEWALHGISQADARTLRGRILVVALQVLAPDEVAELMAELALLDEDRVLLVAVRRLARAVL